MISGGMLIGTRTTKARQPSHRRTSDYGSLESQRSQFQDLSSSGKILLECTKVLTLSRWISSTVQIIKCAITHLLCCCLIGSMPKFRRSVDPFELDLFQSFSTRVCEHGFAKGYDPLLDTRRRTFQEHEVVLDLTVTDKPTHAGR